jgi:hypothetical protein
MPYKLNLQLVREETSGETTTNTPVGEAVALSIPSRFSESDASILKQWLVNCFNLNKSLVEDCCIPIPRSPASERFWDPNDRSADGRRMRGRPVIVHAIDDNVYDDYKIPRGDRRIASTIRVGEIFTTVSDFASAIGVDSVALYPQLRGATRFKSAKVRGVSFGYLDDPIPGQSNID